MKTIITVAAILALVAPTVASADGRHWREPDRYSDRYDHGHRTNPWPFIAGAVVGGILVNAAKANEPRIVYPAGEAPVLVNGTWMQRTYRCVQEIVVDYRGDERLMQRCNYVYVPVQIQTP